VTLRLLLDEALSPNTAAYLRQLGYDALHVSALDALGFDDPEIVALAQREQRVIVTPDLDYGYLLLTTPSAPSAVLLRLKDRRKEHVNMLLAFYLPNVIEPLNRGALVLIEDDDMRIRFLPSATSHD